METTLHHQHRISAIVLAGLFGVAALLVSGPAQASRIPADPIITFVPTPTAMAHLVTDSHAANVRAGLQQLWDDVAGR